MTYNMMLSIYLVLMVACTGVFTAPTNNVTSLAPPTDDVTLVATPPTVLQDFTKTLDLTCAVAHSGSSGTVTSLVVTKAEGSVYSELATVTFQSGEHIDVKESLDAAEVSGKVDNKGRSYIQFKWNYPGIKQLGNYRCDAYIMVGGRTLVKSTTAVVSGQVSKMDVILDRIKELDELLENQTLTIAHMNKYVGHLDWSRLSPTTEYNGHIYYLSPVKSFNDVFQALEFCEAVGGYLAEIDDAAEYTFLKQFVAGTGTYDDYIYLGFHDIDADGIWRSFRSNKPIVFKSGIDGGANEKCAALQNNSLDDYVCTASSPKQGLCEKSL